MNEFDHTGFGGRSGDLGQTPGQQDPQQSPVPPEAGNPWAGHGQPGLGQPSAGSNAGPNAGPSAGPNLGPGVGSGAGPGFGASGGPGAMAGAAHPGANPYGADDPGQPGQSDRYGQTGQFGQPGHPGYPHDPYGAWQHQSPTGQWGTHQMPYPAAYQQPVRRHPMRSIGITVGAIGLSVLIGLGIGRLAWQSNNTASSGTDQNFGNSAPVDPGTPNGGSGNNGNGGSGGGGSGNGGSGGGSGGGGTSNTSIDPNAIASKVDPGLVDVNTVLGFQGAQAAGTGIVLTSNGEVLTNNHVVEGATSIKVTDIGNGHTYTATVIGYDRSHDVAVLSLQGASGLTTANLGDSAKVTVGDAVVGIGNAGGAGGTPSVAAGRVTALNQSITASDDSSGASERLTGLIQVDANIQAGDSGGALANSAGQVVGMNTAASVGTQFQGGFDPNGDPNGGDPTATGHQGFAIPINQAVGIAHQIVGRTASTTVHIGPSAFLGVGVVDARRGTGQQGAVVQNVVNGSAAERAGIAQGDVITSVNGQPVDSATTLTNLMDTHHPGDRLTITWTDQSGQHHSATVVPATGPVG